VLRTGKSEERFSFLRIKIYMKRILIASLLLSCLALAGLATVWHGKKDAVIAEKSGASASYSAEVKRMETGEVIKISDPITPASTSSQSAFSAEDATIMDDTEAIMDGWWNSPPRAYGNAHNGSYKFAACTSETANSFATYRPNLPKAGLYGV